MTPKKQSNLIYLPAPSVAETFWEEFNKHVPPCPGDSSQRMLRYVWGCDRMDGHGEFRRRRYVDYDGKYVGNPRWILEGWQSSDVYSRADWETNREVLGDFPNNGVWDFIEIHETAEHEFLPLDESALERVRSWSFWRSKGHKRSVETIMARLAAQDLVEQENQRIEAEKVKDEFAEQVTKIFENDYKQPVFSLPTGMKKTESGLIVPNH